MGSPLEGSKAHFFTAEPSDDMRGPNTAAGKMVSNMITCNEVLGYLKCG